MGSRIYPSYQDNNTTASGTFIVSLEGSFTEGPINYVDLFNITSNSFVEFRNFEKVNNLIYGNLILGNVYRLTVRASLSTVKGFQMYRTDYTVNDVNGNNGIVTNYITGATNNTSTQQQYTFTAQTSSNAYNFEYRATAYINPTSPTPTPIPTMTPSPTPVPTFTPTPTPSPTPSGPTPTPTSTPTPTPTPIPTSGYTSGYYILVNDSSASYGGTGTTWTSLATGTTYNGKLTNGPIWTGGTPGYFTFDGVNDWVNFYPESSGSTTSSFTFGGWVKTTTSATEKIFMMRGNDGFGGWSLLLAKNTSNKFVAGVVTTNFIPYNTKTAVSTTTMSGDTWYNIVCVWTSNTSIKIYVNGVLEATTLTTTTETNLRTSDIGWNLMRGNSANYTNGSLSEFIVYESALSDANVLNNFYNTSYKYGYGPTPTPAPTATPTPTPTISPFPITGSLFYYDPGNIASYPGSGSVLYDISGNGRHANINTGITWVSGSAAYFDLNGNDNNSITGTTLSQTFTSWSMWIGVYRDDIGSAPDGYDGFMYERTGTNNGNGLGTFQRSNQFDVSVNNGTEITETAPGRMVTGSWMFLGGAVDNTTYTSMVYKSGSIDTYISGSKSAGSSNFDNAIVLGEDKDAGADRTMDGRIGPALMFDRKLSTTELTQINDYFKTRYGI